MLITDSTIPLARLISEPICTSKIQATVMFLLNAVACYCSRPFRMHGFFFRYRCMALQRIIFRKKLFIFPEKMFIKKIEKNVVKIRILVFHEDDKFKLSKPLGMIIIYFAYCRFENKMYFIETAHDLMKLFHFLGNKWKELY